MTSGGRNIKNIAGQRFGALTAMHRAPKVDRRAFWECRCDCGNTCIKLGSRLRAGQVKSCGQNGCSWWKRDPNAATRSLARLHPLEYGSWEQMRARCRGTKFRHYGGRGIQVCERWKKFKHFLADMGPRPSFLHGIDRYPNNNGNYEPGNCRWATAAEQNLNRRNTVFVEYQGERMRLFDVVTKLGLSRSVVYARLALGWDIEDALTRPVRIKLPRKRRRRRNAGLASHRPRGSL